ncbi:MAG: response regulator transcription factor [Chitinophagaceae bacterium]|nr:response regulator transcription factor [Chitinophagaceae bacterium]
MDNSSLRILVVDDEEDILQILEYNLKQEGYQVKTAAHGVDALTLAKTFLPHLILLDVMMPHKNGIEVCRELRANPAFNSTFIVFLTAKSDDASEIEGLETGADDYIRKPIRPKVLMTRVQSILKRIESNKNSVIRFGDHLEINRELFLVKKDGVEINFPRKEFELIALLASKPGRVFLRNEILERVWGNEVIVGDRTIDVHIRKIRQKLDEDYIQTVKGVGYKFDVSNA